MVVLGLWYTILLIIVYFIVRYHWKRRHLYAAARKYNGSLALPLIGNALSFAGKTEEILHKLAAVMETDQNPSRFWLGPQLVLAFSDPHHVEKILSSQKYSHKHDTYKFIRYFLGNGLISADGGPVHKTHRKIMQPMFDLRFVTDSLPTFQKNARTFVLKLERYCGQQQTFNIEPVIKRLIIDIIGECVWGWKMEAQENRNKEFIQAAIDKYDLGFERMVKPWLQPDVIYRMTDRFKRSKKIYDVTHNLMKEVIVESWRRNKKPQRKWTETPVILDQVVAHLEKNPGVIVQEDLVDHMLTLYAASEDTMAVIISYLCLCLGLHPEIQKKVAEEIRTVIGESSREITNEDLTKLTYLDMCVKDVLRLLPIAPYILRRAIEDSEIDNYPVPKGAGIIIPIYNMHRDPKFWERPNEFYPEHFLPEAVKRRPLYSFLPFSAGSRGCIGKLFAYAGIKIVFVHLLQNFEMEADGKLSDIKIKMDISVRPLNDCYDVRLKKRMWK